MLDVLTVHGIRVDLVRTGHRGHAVSLAREAANRGAGVVVAAGGDGTISEVAQGLLGSDAALGIIPLGTANVLAHELGIAFSPKACAATLGSGRTRLLWPGLARNGSGGPRAFMQMCGVGFDAAVVQGLPPRLKRLMGRGAFAVQSLREMARYRFPRLVVRLDGRPMQATSIVVTKGRLYAGPYLLAPDALPTEPGFQVALFGCGQSIPGPASAALYGGALLLNMLPRAPGLRLIRAEEVEVDADLPAQTDGEPAGAGPLRVTSAPRPIPVVVA